jgi:hypothetical protein
MRFVLADNQGRALLFGVRIKKKMWGKWMNRKCHCTLVTHYPAWNISPFLSIKCHILFILLFFEPPTCRCYFPRYSAED